MSRAELIVCQLNRHKFPHTGGAGLWVSQVYGNCVPELDLTEANDPASGPLTGYQYYTAESNINSSRKVHGGIGTDVTYRAGSSVTLTDGFTASLNNDFTAIIAPCFPEGPAPMSAGLDPNIVVFAGPAATSENTGKPKYSYKKPPIIW